MKKNGVALLLIFWCMPLHAAESVIDAHYDFGRRGSTGAVEEEDLTDEFYYSKYGIKFSQELDKKTSYYIKYQHYKKNFDTLQDLSNNFDFAGLGMDTQVYSSENFSFKIGPDFSFKQKLYNGLTTSNYDQLKLDLPLVFKGKRDWSVKLTGGINSYHYPNAPKDQLKLNARLDVKKKFFEERLEVAAFCRFQEIYRQKIADRFEKTYGASVGLKVDCPVIKEIEAGLEEGMDNTIIYEDREDSYDYRYFDWFLKARYLLFEMFKGTTKYIDLRRSYADFDHNYDGFIVDNDWKIRIFEKEGTAFDLKLVYFHKQYRFPYVSSPYSFHNNNIGAEAEVKKRGDWSFSAGYDTKFYDYPAKRTNDKIYYIARAGFEKYLLKRSVKLGFDYKYTFKNYLHKMDITENVFKFRATYKF